MKSGWNNSYIKLHIMLNGFRMSLLQFLINYSDLGVEGGPEWSLGNIYIIKYF